MTNEDQFENKETIVLKKDFKKCLKEAFFAGVDFKIDGSTPTFEEWFNKTYKYVKLFSGEDKGITFK